VTDFRMPALGADMEAGTLVEWLIKPGDIVKSGDIVAVVETQKGAIEVEAFIDGEVHDIVVPPGREVPVGTLLARIGPDEGTPSSAPAPTPPETIPVAPPPPGMPGERRKATPAARREAARRGLDLAALAGSGVDGAITLADLDRAPPPARLPARAGFDAAEMRKAIAAAMSRAKREIPHYYLAETVDLGRAMAWLAERNAAVPPDRRILPPALLLKAAAVALRDAPRLNGVYENSTFVPASGIHPGWAIALRGGGLVAPAIRDADARDLASLMEALRDLVQRARAGGLRLSELTGGTVTFTSLGDQGAESVTGVIYPPQVAILGFGRITPRALVVDGRVEARPSIALSLAADHRVTDGHLGSRYLTDIARLLQEPESL
jgi:pyruvate dehydrogenase E2 component (dihydrolipoamide acetyltransferase)